MKCNTILKNTIMVNVFWSFLYLTVFFSDRSCTWKCFHWSFSTWVVSPESLTSKLYSACRFWSNADRICCQCTVRWCNTSKQQIQLTSCPGSRHCCRFLFCPLLHERVRLWEPPVIELPLTVTQYHDVSLFIDPRSRILYIMHSRVYHKGMTMLQ